MRLQRIDAESYARDVLPLTAELWAGRRDFEQYVTHTVEIANSGYGRRHFALAGLFNGRELLASFKRYERFIEFGRMRLRAIGIGAVYTPPDRRGRGYASAMLAMALDAARSEGADAAYLFSDIRPQFYADLGFERLASRAISLRADSLDDRRIEVRRLEEADWSGVRRCFANGNALSPWHFSRSPLVWDFVRLKLRQAADRASGVPANLVVRRGRSIAAYVIGVRSPEHDAFILEECGYADDTAGELVAPLLRSAAGDLRRVVGWLPPAFVRERVPRASVRRRTDAIFMAVALSKAGTQWLASAREPSPGDGVWNTDHI